MAEHDAHEETHAAPVFRVEKFFLIVSLFVALFLVIISSLWTDSSLFFTFIGYLPLFGTIGILLVLVENSYKNSVYWGAPFFTSVLFLIIFGLLNPLFGYQLDVGALAVVNLIFGLLVVLVVTIMEGRAVLPVEDDVEITPENIDEYMLGIEDKCKALNFVIGRVYRMSNGGSEKIRARLRIEKDWYNEFHSLTKDIDQNRDEALAVLHKINDRLSLLMKPEKDVLHKKELGALKHIARDKDGNDRIVDVLVANDRDPVEHYYVGAVEGTQKLIGALRPQ